VSQVTPMGLQEFTVAGLRCGAHSSGERRDDCTGIQFCREHQRGCFQHDPLRTEGGAQAFPLTITQERHKSVYNAEPKVQTRTSTPIRRDEGVCGVHPRWQRALVTGEHGLMVAQVMDGIYRSAEEGREITIG